MQLALRWFGPSDLVRLEHIRQIPGVESVVSALYDVAIGDVWTVARLQQLRAEIERAGLRLAVIESIPVHEDIKLGLPARARYIDNYCESILAMGEVGVRVLCYNFMPVFDWMRTDLAMRLSDGSFALAYAQSALDGIDLSRGTGELPGWAAAYDADTLRALLHAYAKVDAEQLWDNYAWFLERVVPVAEASGVKLAVHPDDPPWPIFGLPRIITDMQALERLTDLVPSPANGITLCTGSLAAAPANDVVSITKRLAGQGRIHFVHCRNVKVTGTRQFHEVQHPTEYGDVDMFEVLHALHDVGYRGTIRPDHGRMIWHETGRPGYGLYDRALGATYLKGLWEAITRERKT
jgi:mannonate dehydratase